MSRLLPEVVVAQYLVEQGAQPDRGVLKAFTAPKPARFFGFSREYALQIPGTRTFVDGTQQRPRTLLEPA